MYYNNRVACDVLEEMRKLNGALSINTLDRHQEVMKYLIEEAQVMYNKMEVGLGDKRDLVSMAEEHSKNRKKHKKFTKELRELKAEIKEVKGEEEESGSERVTSIIEDLALDEPLDEEDDE